MHEFDNSMVKACVSVLDLFSFSHPFTVLRLGRIMKYFLITSISSHLLVSHCTNLYKQIIR